MIPASSGGTHAFRIMPEGDVPRAIPISSPQENRGEMTVVSSIDDAGTLRSEVDFQGFGARDAILRGFYYVDPAKRKEWFSYMLAGISPSSKLTDLDLSPDNLDDLTRPVTYELHYQADDYLIEAGSYLLFRMTGNSSSLDWIRQDVEEAAALKTREYPLDLMHTSTLSVTETMTFPEKYCVRTLPENVSVNNDCIEYTQIYESAGSSVICRQTFAVKKERIPPGDYPAFRDSVKKLKDASRRYVILEEKNHE